MPTEKPSSNPRAQPSSDPDSLKQGIQEAQVSLQKYLILFILHIISSSSSSQRYKWTLRLGGLRISHIGLHELYYETRALLSRNKSQMYDKEKHEGVKVIILYKSTMESKT